MKESSKRNIGIFKNTWKQIHVTQITLPVSISLYLTLFKILINDIANNYTKTYQRIVTFQKTIHLHSRILKLKIFSNPVYAVCQINHYPLRNHWRDTLRHNTIRTMIQTSYSRQNTVCTLLRMMLSIDTIFVLHHHWDVPWVCFFIIMTFTIICKCARYLVHDVVRLWTILYHNHEMI